MTGYTVLDPNVTLAPATRTGYDFEGWYDNPTFTGTAVTGFPVSDAADKHYYAKWSAPKSYTVQWNLNDGTPAGHPATNPNTVASYTVLDADVTIRPATRTGYDFEGWYDNPGLTGTPVTNLHTMDAENKQYYAKWSAAKSYTVQWHLNDATPAGHPASNPNTVASYTVQDADVTIQPATRTGYTFLGWYDNVGFAGVPVTTLRTMDAEDKAYYAKWDTTPNSYPINYVLNDGSLRGTRRPTRAPISQAIRCSPTAAAALRCSRRAETAIPSSAGMTTQVLQALRLPTSRPWMRRPRPSMQSGAVPIPIRLHTR